jgi:hypothetical protein
MNAEMLAREAQSTPATKEETAQVAGQAAEITPVSFDNYKLVGGGSSIVLFD